MYIGLCIFIGQCVYMCSGDGGRQQHRVIFYNNPTATVAGIIPNTGINIEGFPLSTPYVHRTTTHFIKHKLIF